LDLPCRVGVDRRRGLAGGGAAARDVAGGAAQALGLPFVFTAHGMLVPWLWTQQGWRVRAKKALYWRALAQPANGVYLPLLAAPAPAAPAAAAGVSHRVRAAPAAGCAAGVPARIPAERVPCAKTNVLIMGGRTAQQLFYESNF
jgi:hypothetical protein